MESRTTINYKGVQYPFYITNRGKFDFENAGFTNADIAKGSFAAQLALVYYNLKDCAKRAGNPINDSFEEFIDNTEPDVINVFLRLKEEKEAKAKAEVKTEGKAKAETEGEQLGKLEQGNPEPGTRNP